MINEYTAIIIEGQFQVFQRVFSSQVVLETVESCFVALNYYENGSKECPSAGRSAVMN